jgi:hypothetical protein
MLLKVSDNTSIAERRFEMGAFYRTCALGMGILLVSSALSAQDTIPWVVFSGPAIYPRATSPSDEAAARQAHQAVGAPFMIWFRLDGTAYVSEDNSTRDRMNRLTSLKSFQPGQLEHAERVRRENLDYAASHPVAVTDATAAELRQLAESIRQMASTPPSSSQDVSDLRKRAMAMVDVAMQMQAQVVRRDSINFALQSTEKMLQEYGTERQILLDAIASGKARRAP